MLMPKSEHEHSRLIIAFKDQHACIVMLAVIALSLYFTVEARCLPLNFYSYFLARRGHVLAQEAIEYLALNPLFCSICWTFSFFYSYQKQTHTEKKACLFYLHTNIQRRCSYARLTIAYRSRNRL